MPTNLVLTRSPSPVQRIQGYVERSETVTIAGNPPQNIQVQKSYPNATVTVYERKSDGQFQTTEPAKIFNRDGTSKGNPVQADANAYYFFYAQPGRYDVRFSGPGIPTFNLEDVPVESLVFNVRDYGARGDGDDQNPNRDDGVAIRAAIAAMVASNGGPPSNGLGTLYFPNGIYIVRTPIDLPSGITLQGTNSQYSGDAGSNCLIALGTENSSLFTIKTNRQRIVIRDLGMTTIGTGVLPGSRAIDAREDIAGGLVTAIEFDNLTIWSFDRGISVESLNETEQWDFNNVRVNHCNIGECNYCIYLNSQTCDLWRITDSRIGGNPGFFGIYLAKVGIITIDNILGAANLDPMVATLADSFIYLTPAHGTVTIINCECEGFINSINVSASVEGNISWPILVLNSSLGPNVMLSHNCDYVSLGNRYLPGTVQCANNGTDVMIFSFGDIFCGNQATVPDPASDFVLHGHSRVAARSNRFRTDFQRPTRIGGQPGQPPPVLENIALAIAPLTEVDPHMVLCDYAGTPIWKVRADQRTLYFANVQTDETIMSLDKGGNIIIKGTLTENTTP